MDIIFSVTITNYSIKKKERKWQQLRVQGGKGTCAFQGLGLLTCFLVPPFWLNTKQSVISMYHQCIKGKVQVHENERRTRGVYLGVDEKVRRRRIGGVCLWVGQKVKRRRMGGRSPHVHEKFKLWSERQEEERSNALVISLRSQVLVKQQERKGPQQKALHAPT